MKPVDVKPLRALLPVSITHSPQEVGDVELWPMRRSFTADHQAWRLRMVNRLAVETRLFTTVSSDATVVALRALVDEESAGQQVMARILELVHGTPDLGNKTDPVDELVYIMLSRRTDEGAYQAAFTALKEAYPSWDALADASTDDVASLIDPSGLGDNKSRNILAALRMIRDHFGTVSLEALREWPDNLVETFLTSLPGVGRKTAYCVMMYALGRAAFPVDAHAGRVLSRTGLFRSAGLDLSRWKNPAQHRKLQEVLADIVAPELRHSLHVNLVAHGRAICTPRKPKCGSCPISRQCAFFRQQQVEAAEKSDRYTMVDMFCGAGGLSEGFRQAGMRTLLAVDSNPVAIRTYRLNHPDVPEDRVLCEDLRDFRADAERIRGLIGEVRVDVLIGGPPCQGFSRAGWRSRGTGQRFTASEDDRNYLFRELVGLLEVLNPRVVVMENVPGLGEVTFPDGKKFLQVTRDAMEEQGYHTEVWMLNAAAYGVPQHRVRKIIVGTRDGEPPVMPEVRYRAAAVQYREHSRSEDMGLEDAVTLWEGIADLPPVDVDDGDWISYQDPNKPREFSRLLDNPRNEMLHPQGLIFSHVSRFQNETDLERFGELEPGENYLKLLERRPDLKNYRDDGFNDKYYRLRPDQPSKTIVAHLNRDGNSYIHPTQVRSITVREAARLQSFPDSYIFTGSRKDQFVQVGNAVPPLLARAIGERLAGWLDDHQLADSTSDL